MTEPTHQPDATDHEELVPFALRVIASWSWRLLVIAAVVLGLWQLGTMYAGILVPIFVAVLLTALLTPIYRGLRNANAPSALAGAAALLVLLGVVGGIVALVSTQIASQWPQLVANAQKGISDILRMLANTPWHIGSGQSGNLVQDIGDWVNRSRDTIVDWVTSAGSGVVGFLAGGALALVSTFFFLMDGHRFSSSVLGILPPKARVSLEHAGSEGWKVLGLYVRAAMMVAAIDGLTAGIGAAILGSNLFLAIGALEFILAFVPIVGNFISAFVAVGVAFVTLGPTKALIMGIIFIVLMLLEGNVWQPLLLGRAADIHPLMILLGISFGIALAGIVGAVFAIPTVAFVTAFSKALNPQSLLADQRTKRRKRRVVDLSAGQLPDAGEGDEDLSAYFDAAVTSRQEERRLDRLRRQVIDPIQSRIRGTLRKPKK